MQLMLVHLISTLSGSLTTVHHIPCLQLSVEYIHGHMGSLTPPAGRNALQIPPPPGPHGHGRSPDLANLLLALGIPLFNTLIFSKFPIFAYLLNSFKILFSLIKHPLASCRFTSELNLDTVKLLIVPTSLDFE